MKSSYRRARRYGQRSFSRRRRDWQSPTSRHLHDTENIMKTRSIVIIGGGVILAAVVLGVLGPWLLPTTFGGSAYGGMMGPGMMGGYGMMKSDRSHVVL